VTTPEDDSLDDPYLVYETITDAAYAEHRRVQDAANALYELVDAPESTEDGNP